MRYIRTYLLATALLMTVGLCVTPANAQLARAYIAEDSVTVGDRFTLVVVAEHAMQDSIRFPVFEVPPGALTADIGDLAVFEPISSGRRLLGVGYNYPIADTIVYEVTTFALDTAYVPTIPVAVVSPQGQRRIGSEPFFFLVSSVVPENAENIRDITPLESFPRSIWPYLLGLLLIGAAAYGVRRWMRRQPAPTIVEPPPPPPKPVESPIAEANRRLAILENTDLSDDEQIKPFFVELTETLRTYIERRLKLPALETSTHELLDQLGMKISRSHLPDDLIDDTGSLLEVADLAKFADVRHPEDQCRLALGETRVLVLRIEGSLAPTVDASSDEDHVPDEDMLPVEGQGATSITVGHVEDSSSFEPKPPAGVDTNEGEGI